MVDTAPVLPAYGTRSLAEVTPSLIAALRGEANPLAIEPAGRICLLLVDGLGSELLAAHSADAPFLASLPGVGALTAGFPSSTPVSLASLGTGAPPGAHGILGVSFAVDGSASDSSTDAGHGGLLDSLKWTAEVDGKPVDQRKSLPPEEIQPVETALGRARDQGVDVRVASAAMFAGSGLTRATLRGADYRGVYALGDLAAELITALAAPPPVFCYGYHANLDALGHLHGPGTLPWRLELRIIDRVAALVAEALPPDGLLVITADHGMVHVPPADKIDADTTPELQQGVRLLGGDPRSRHVYARPGAAGDVLATWTGLLGERAWVRTREQAIADGWFGQVTDAMRGRIGDVVVAMRGSTAVTRSKGEPLISALTGQHGSLTAAEQHIPLLQARR